MPKLLIFFVCFLLFSVQVHASNTIASGQTLFAGDIVTSNNGNFSLGIDSQTGKMVFHYRFSNPAWGSGATTKLFGTSAEGSLGVAGGDRLVMQTDGNLVLYSGNTVIWESYRAGQTLYPGAYAVIEDYGDLVVYPPGGSSPVFLWPFAAVRSGQNIGVHDSVAGYGFGINFFAPSNQPSLFQLFNNYTYYTWKGMQANGAAMQSDGNFVITNNGTPVWATNTAGNPGAFVTITPAGFMVVSINNQLIANVAYPFSVNNTTKAAPPGQKTTQTQPPAPDQLIPIGPGWTCYTYSTSAGSLVCFAPG